MKSRYEDAKNVFIDSIDINDYIELEPSSVAYKQLSHALEKPLKMVLLFGKPGTGKSILLHRLFNNFKHQKEIHYLETPATNEDNFLRQLFVPLTKESIALDAKVNFGGLINYCKSIRGKREVIFLLDEAQMYGPEILEKIRLLSDTRAVKFIIALHKTEDEDLIAKAHFQSRIWEIIELKNATREELATYIHKKLLNKNLFDIASSIKAQDIRLIHKMSQGNYRECNKLLFAIFEICEYYDKNEPLKINYHRVPRKVIEMAGLKLGHLHA
ncbi:MAG TPA: AAA family ATPase [Epsilonproteobacteria bacterium]|nr:AAA family ATPase [Campylobacterota bacterium]